MSFPFPNQSVTSRLMLTTSCHHSGPVSPEGNMMEAVKRGDEHSVRSLLVSSPLSGEHKETAARFGQAHLVQLFTDMDIDGSLVMNYCTQSLTAVAAVQYHN